jgi:DNA-binding response OmpR family regulator
MHTRIQVKVFGGVDLFNRLCAGASSANVRHGFFKNKKVDWDISWSLGEPALDGLFAPSAAVVIVETGHAEAMAKIRTLDFCGAPVIAVCDSWRQAADAHRFSCAIADWIVGSVNCDELFHRAMFLISKQVAPKRERDFGVLRILHDSRTIVSGSRSRSLTEFEFNLAEFFLSKAGTIVSTTRVLDFFRQAGRSAQRNNVRVAISALRTKLEEISDSQVSVVNVYRKGYSLRQRRDDLSTH